MNDEPHGSRALPPPLSLGLWLIAVQSIVMAVVWTARLGEHGPPAWLSLTNLGADLTASTLCACGAAELARHHTGARRRGLQLAGAAWVAGAVLQLMWLGVSMLQRDPFPSDDDLWIAVERYGWSVVELLPAVGLAIATARRHRARALVNVVIVAVHYPPTFVAQAIWGWLGLRGTTLLHTTLSLVGVALIATLAATLAPAATLPEPGSASAGLRRAAAGLRIRMLAAIIGTTPILFALANHKSGAFATYELALVAGAAVHAAAFGWLASGLLAAARAGGPPRIPLVLAGAASLWCGAVALVQLMSRYAVLDDRRDSWAQAYAEALVLGVPLVALAGAVVLAAALGPLVARYRHDQRGTAEANDATNDATNIATNGAFPGLAARTREDQRRRDATGRLPWIAVLLLASAVIEGWLLPSASSRGNAEVLTLASAVCSLVALAMLARLCSEASEALGRMPGLPAARLIGPD